MRIARIEALAYGAISGREIVPGPGLTVVHGPNESGKSSTMDLIRGVLFGFPPLRRAGDGALREPKGGGQRSGRLELELADGRRIVVERTHGVAVRVTDADGEPLGDAALAQALGIADRALFDAVQTFDANDLARLDLLDDPSVRSGLLASAVLGGGVGAEPVLRDLRTRADALYLRSGENQPYAHALRHLKATRKALRDAEEEAARLAAAGDGLATAAERVAEAERQLAAAAGERDRLERRRALRAALDRVAELEQVPLEEESGPPADPEAAAELRAVSAELPVALDALRRADAQRRTAGDEAQRAGEARARLALDPDAPLPDLAAETALREAAAALEAADREAERLRAAAEAVADAPPVPVAAAGGPDRRRPIGLGLLALGLLAVVAGALGGLGLVLAAGIAIAFVGGVLASGLVGAGAAADRPVALDPERERRREAAGEGARALEQARTRWTDALGAVGITAVLRPDQLGDVLAALGAAREADRLAAQARRHADEEAVVAGGIVERARAALDRVGVEAPAEPAALGPALERASEQAEAAIAREARQAAAREARREAVAAARAEAEALAGGDAELAREAAALDLAALEAEFEVLEARIAWLRDSELAEANRELGAVRALSERAGESTDVAAAAQAEADAAADLRAIADRWLTARLAHDVLARARDRFVDEHQPGVLRRAAEQVALATGGAWTGLRMPDGERAGARSEVIGREGGRIPFSELSQGTVGLVYLCLRAGLVDEMRASGGVELPVVMDDVLTHLDPERRGGGARVVADLATRHQVIYFTCHDEQVEALRAACPDLVERPLERLV